jgi:hypothetical protein
MTDACRRWAALTDGVTAGATLGPGDERFVGEHAASCEACRAEAWVWDRLELTLSDPNVLLRPGGPSPSDRGADDTRVQEGPVEALSERARPGLRRWRIAAVAAGFAATAGVAVVASGVFDAPTTDGAATVLAFVSGDVLVNQARAKAGQPLSDGDAIKVVSGNACLLLKPGVTACAESDTVLVIGSTEPKLRRLRLQSGAVMARLEPQPKGATFGVETVHGSFIAKGTSFAVELGKDGVPELRVHEGTVSIEPRTGRAQSVSGPAVATLTSDESPRPLAASEAIGDARLLTLSSAFSAAATCTLEVAASPLGRVALDGTELGQVPLTALVEHGSHRLTLELAGFGPVAERLTLRPGEHVTRSYELSPLAETETETETRSSSRTRAARVSTA